MFEGKKIVLNPLKPKPINISKKTEAPKAKDLNIISPKAFERVVVQESIVFVLVARELHGEIREEQPEEVSQFSRNLRKFSLRTSRIIYRPCMTYNTP